nr:immunoglobulin heavy chain junction region [Macaca mulatta]MOW81261.1 immunoglobulin heavy chain junction region [Macaca mulatta]
CARISYAWGHGLDSW